MKRTLSLFLGVWMLLTMFAPLALALETTCPEPPLILHYERAAEITATLTKSSNILTCKGGIKSKTLTDGISISMTLKRKSGNSWVYVDGWSTSGTYSVLLSKTSSSLSSGTYKLFVTGTVSGGDSSEFVSKESKEIKV